MTSDYVKTSYITREPSMTSDYVKTSYITREPRITSDYVKTSYITREPRMTSDLNPESTNLEPDTLAIELSVPVAGLH